MFQASVVKCVSSALSPHLVRNSDSVGVYNISRYKDISDIARSSLVDALGKRALTWPKHNDLTHFLAEVQRSCARSCEASPGRAASLFTRALTWPKCIDLARVHAKRALARLLHCVSEA